MLLVLIFAGLPLVSHADEHVTMDFIDRLLPPRGASCVVRVSARALRGGHVLPHLAGVDQGRHASPRYGDTTDVLRITVGPFVYFMAVMIALTGLVHLYKMFVAGRGARLAGHHLSP